MLKKMFVFSGVMAAIVCFAMAACEDFSKVYPPPPEVSGVLIDPPSATAFPDSYIQFHGEALIVQGSADTGVTWSVTGAEPGTSITSAGSLYISPTQSASLTVVARSKANTGVSNTAPVTIKEPGAIAGITISGDLERTTYYRGTPIDRISLAGLTVTVDFGGGDTDDITAGAKSFLVITNGGDMNTAGEVEFTVQIDETTASSVFSITIQELLVPVMNFDDPASGWVRYTEPGYSILFPLEENLVSPFGPVGTVLPKKSAATDFAARTWILHGNGDNMNQSSYSAIVRNSEVMPDGGVRQVLRFSKEDGSTGNSGPMYRIPIGSLPLSGQWYYINTWLKLISSNGPLATGDTNEYRISIYNTVTTAITTSPVRSKVVLGGGPSDTGNVKKISNDWQDYTFLVFVPETHQNKFLEIRLFVPNSEKAITVDMTDVEMIKAPAPY